MDINLNGRNQGLIQMRPSETQRRIAQITAREAARVLGIETPEISFFYRNQLETLSGFAEDNRIGVALDLGDRETITVTLHECRHIWQRQSPQWQNKSEEQRERDAKCFELGWPRW